MDTDLDIRILTDDDDLDAFGQIVLGSYLALPDMPRTADYEAEVVDVAARVRDGVVLGAFLGETPAGCVTFVADASSPHAESLLSRRRRLRSPLTPVDRPLQRDIGNSAGTKIPIPRFCPIVEGRLF